MSDVSTVASEPTVQTPSLESLDSTQLDHWRMTGELPSADTPSTPPADSSPAQPAEQADRTESSLSPASEPGKPSKKSNADTRVSELLNERHQIREEVERLRRELAEARTPPRTDAPPAASSPAPATLTLVRVDKANIRLTVEPRDQQIDTLLAQVGERAATPEPMPDPGASLDELDALLSEDE